MEQIAYLKQKISKYEQQCLTQLIDYTTLIDPQK